MAAIPRRLNAEFALGFLAGTVCLLVFVGWISAYTPTEVEKQDCREAAKKAGFKTEECKTIWERTTSDPVALFTFVLAVSTVGLWGATGLLYLAGERQIAVASKSAHVAERALVELEAPFLSVEILNSGLRRRQDGIGHHFEVLSFSIANYGRTPARLIEVVDKTWLVPILYGHPPKIDLDFRSRNTMPYGVIAPPAGRTQAFTQNLLGNHLDDLAVDQTPLKANAFFFYGFVRYETILNQRLRLGFCFIFDKFGERWVLNGEKGYNYLAAEGGPSDGEHRPSPSSRPVS